MIVGVCVVIPNARNNMSTIFSIDFKVGFLFALLIDSCSAAITLFKSFSSSITHNILIITLMTRWEH